MQAQTRDIHIEISLSDALQANETNPIDGRVLVMLTRNDESEPRSQVTAGYKAIPIFGVDINEFDAKGSIVFDGSVFGYPIESLNNLPSGRYFVQALIHKYDTFQLATGHTVKLPMPRGAGQNWRKEPGNLFSTPVPIEITDAAVETIRLTIDQVNPPIAAAEDTKYIKHIRIKSQLLSDFWGRDMHLGAHVLVPHGFDEKPDARYPLMVFHGHFPDDFGGFRTTPPDPNLKADYSTRFSLAGYNIIQQQEAYDFYEKWIRDDFPRFIAVEIQHDNPYYDDSYAVNSANLGPYGDAIMKELVPEIERQFRGIGEGWARFTYGGSTGGWEAMAVQLFYPDDFNGAFAACPDPLDFREFVQVNLYEDKNAYYYESEFRPMDRPARRDYLGQLQGTARDYNHLELVLGTKGRSGDQYDIWQAVYSPMGDDGYPKPIYDKLTGEIDPDVAVYWKENYDLNYIMKRDWETLGPKLKGNYTCMPVTWTTTTSTTGSI